MEVYLIRKVISENDLGGDTTRREGRGSTGREKH